MNGGVCIDGVDTFSCSCPPLLTGMLCECLMIGEDSLDCNYTVSISTMPPTTIIRPITPTAAAAVTTTTTAEVTPHVSAIPMVTTTRAAASVSTSVETEETEEEAGAGVGSEKAKPPPATATTAGSAVSISTDEKPRTTEASRSYTAESGSSVESSYSSEGSASVEGGTSDEYTTPSRLDASSAEKGVPTTAKTTISAADSDYTPGSSAVSKSAESDEGPVITYSTRPPFKHYVTTIETTFSIDYSATRPTSLRPTPTIFFPSSTVHILPDLSGKHIPTEYPEYPDQEITSPHRVSTTAAPFFTEYPEVAVTTRYKDFTSKDLGMITTGRPTTYPSTPSSLTPTIVRIGSTLHPQLGGETASSTVTPATGVTAERPDAHHHHHHHHHHHYPSTHVPATGAEEFTQPPLTTQTHIYPHVPTHTTEHTHYHHVDHTTHQHHYEGAPTTVAVPLPTIAEVTTTQPLYTEDLVSHITTLRPAVTPVVVAALPTTIAPEPESAETTQPPPPPQQPTTPRSEPPTPATSFPAATLPPSTATTTRTVLPTYGPPTELAPAPGTPAPAYTTSPSPPVPTTSIPIYSTYAPPSGKPITTTMASSEEVESANTVATGGETGIARGGATPVGGAGGVDNTTEVDCIKMGCYNGGTCVTTSEGSRVSH